VDKTQLDTHSNENPTQTFPSLQGTLAKRTKPTLQPNFAKEPSSPSRSDSRHDNNAAKLKTEILKTSTASFNKCICHKGFSGYSSVVAA
jgi:hypothetical protein